MAQNTVTVVNVGSLANAGVLNKDGSLSILIYAGDQSFDLIFERKDAELLVEGIANALHGGNRPENALRDGDLPDPDRAHRCP
jgi:hypothetical protein